MSSEVYVSTTTVVHTPSFVSDKTTTAVGDSPVLRRKGVTDVKMKHWTGVGGPRTQEFSQRNR